LHDEAKPLLLRLGSNKYSKGNRGNQWRGCVTMHIPDMASEGLNEFVIVFYPQLTKMGLLLMIEVIGGGICFTNDS
jgi:hypothetical protein